MRSVFSVWRERQLPSREHSIRSSQLWIVGDRGPLTWLLCARMCPLTITRQANEPPFLSRFYPCRRGCSCGHWLGHPDAGEEDLDSGVDAMAWLSSYQTDQIACLSGGSSECAKDSQSVLQRFCRSARRSFQCKSS